MLAARGLRWWPANRSVSKLLYGERAVYCADSTRPVGRVFKDAPSAQKAELLVVTGRLNQRIRRVRASMVAHRDTDGVRLVLTRAEFFALPGYVPDEELRDAVYESMQASERMRNFGLASIDVGARDGQVVLRGYVPDHAFREEAELRARRTWGVLSVENRLLTDWDLEVAVSRAFTAYRELQPSLVRVEADLGTVTLGGELPTHLAELARSVAERVPGVAKVESRILSRFQDRRDAGRQVAEHLLEYRSRPDVLVLALPRGGTPVAYEVARALRAPLDLLVVRKLFLPGAGRTTAGAIAPGGIRVLNRDVVERLRVRQHDIEHFAALAQVALEREERSLGGRRPVLDPAGRTVIVVDDGMETGSTVRAAIAALRQRHPKEIVVAVPVAPASTCGAIAGLADRMVCLMQPEQFRDIGTWYHDYREISDSEVDVLFGRQERRDAA